MKYSTPGAPTLAAVVAACVIFFGVVYLKVIAQTPSPAPVTSEQTVSLSQIQYAAQWFLTVFGFISLVIGIVYGFFKKQKYDNILKDRDEWKGIAESREERIKELGHIANAVDARHKLKVKECDTSITNLKESNNALVSLCLQMKAILRDLRLAGLWTGHEDRIYDDHRDELGGK